MKNLENLEDLKNKDKNADFMQIAKILFAARTQARPIAQLSKQGIELTRLEAYQVQEAGILLREQSGEKRIGLKMGLTSEGKRKQMNLDSPLYGELTDKMQILHTPHDAGGKAEINIAGLIHSKIEPEIAFLITQDLEGTVTREQVLEATSAICACMEILDSRYEQFKYFSMEDVIADNSSSSHYILGPWVKDFKNLDLRKLKMKMSARLTTNAANNTINNTDNEIVHEALASEISGDPVVSIIELCRLLALRGRKLKANTFVLAGAATAAVELKEGLQVSLLVDHLPPLHINVIAEKS